MRLAILLALAALTTAGTCHEGPPRPPRPSVDAGTADDCEAACARLEELGCPLPLEAGRADCAAACRNVEELGDFTLCPAFVKTATSCEEAKHFSRCAEGSP